MSTSQPGSDDTSQEVANMRIKELERELFIANGVAQEIKQDLETQLQKTRQDLETENRNLRGESIERKLAASYDMQQTIRESNTLKEELATLRTLLAAKEEEHPKEDTASKNPPDTSESPLGNASLQAEITRLTEEVEKLTKTKKSMQKHILEVQGLAEKYEKRIDNNIIRLKTYQEYTHSLEKDVVFYRETFQELHIEQQVGEEVVSAIYADAQRVAEDAQHAQGEFLKKLNTEMQDLHAAICLLQSQFSSAHEILSSGLQATSAAQAKSDGTWMEMHSHLGRSYENTIAMALKALQHKPTTVLPRLSQASNVVPASDTISGNQIDGKTFKTDSAPQLPKDGKLKDRKENPSTIAETAEDDVTKSSHVEASSTSKNSQDNERGKKQEETPSTSKFSHDDGRKECQQGPSANAAGPTHDGTKAKQAEVLLSPKHNVSKAGPNLKEQSNKKGTSQEEDVQKSIASCRNSGSNYEKQTALPEHAAHQGSELILKLESEIKEADLRYQELEGQYKGLEQIYQELQRIHADVSKENAALNKKIGGTLEAFIPKAEKMLHKGMRIDKSTRDVLNSLIKIVRDGLRDD